MPRQSPNREDGEAGAEDRDRRIKKVKKYILIIAASIFCFAILGMCFAYFVLDYKRQLNAYSIPTSLVAGAILIIGLFFYLWLSKPRYRREIRGQYRNFRRAIRRIPLPEFCTRHLRRIHPQPRVMVNTISVRPQPTPTYAAADCSVQIETPPIRPSTPTPPERSNIRTLPFRNFEDSHRSRPTPTYAAAGCSVPIENPSPTRPSPPTSSEHSNIETLPFSIFDETHGCHPNPNILHQD